MSAKLKEIMTTDLITVEPHETMDKVKEIFSTSSIHHLPVVSAGKIIGIISKSDYLMLLHGFTLFKTVRSKEYNDSVLRSLLVKEVMTKQVSTLGPDDSVEIAANFFLENLFHSIPVTDRDGGLLGIVTTYDLIKFAFGSRKLVGGGNG